MLAKAGMNSAGIGVCSNMLVSDRDGAGAGIPYHFLLRGVLQATNLSDAIEAVTRSSRISSGNFLIAARGGEAIDIEFAPNDFGWLLPQDGLIAHANHFESGLPVKDLRRNVSPLTLIRSGRVRHLLEDRLRTRDVSACDVQAVLKDHLSHPKSICRHPAIADDPLEQSASLFSVLMDMDAERMMVSPYPVCESIPYTIDLSDLGSRSAVQTG
jgi:isopenicillin-N N-acyltransferase-like protein